MNRQNWSSDKIFERLLTNKSTKTYWDNIRELRSRPNQEVFDKAVLLAQASSKKKNG